MLLNQRRNVLHHLIISFTYFHGSIVSSPSCIIVRPLSNHFSTLEKGAADGCNQHLQVWWRSYTSEQTVIFDQKIIIEGYKAVQREGYGQQMM